MATVIQIKGADFSGRNLPIITPLYEDGLIAAYRPSLNLTMSKDLSGNNVAVSQVGTPVWHDTYIECDYENGLSTDVEETASFTMVYAAKTKAVDGSLTSFLGGSYTGGRGLSITRGASNFNFQTFAKRTTDNTYQNVQRAIAVQDMQNEQESNWDIWVVSVDALSNKLITYSTCGVYAEYDGAANNYNFADRDSIGRKVHIGKPSYNTASTYKAKSLIAEALFYNRALSKDEISKVVSITRKAMAAKGLII